MTKKHYLCPTNCYNTMKRLLFFQAIAMLFFFINPCAVYAETTPAETQEDGTTEGTDKASIPKKKPRYTFGDFFDALDLPTVVGGSFCPNGTESGTFNSAMRLGWRHHKNYGAYAFIAYDAHSRTYNNLSIESTNVSSGEVWYHTISMGAGYRIPLVRDIRAFYENPYFHPWDFFAAIDPGINIAVVKDVKDNGGQDYTLTDRTSYIPTLRFSAGAEWFIFSNFGVFAEIAYTQHLMPTVIDKAAMAQGKIQNPSGSITCSIGLSLFFN